MLSHILFSIGYANILPECCFAFMIRIRVFAKGVDFFRRESSLSMMLFQFILFIVSESGLIVRVVFVAIIKEAFHERPEQNITRGKTMCGTLHQPRSVLLRLSCPALTSECIHFFISPYIYFFLSPRFNHAASNPPHTSPATAYTSSGGVLMQAAAAVASVGAMIHRAHAADAAAHLR
jgi:hypothetical protein